MAGGPNRLTFTVPPLAFSALKVCSFQHYALVGCDYAAVFT